MIFADWLPSVKSHHYLLWISLHPIHTRPALNITVWFHISYRTSSCSVYRSRPECVSCEFDISVLHISLVLTHLLSAASHVHWCDQHVPKHKKRLDMLFQHCFPLIIMNSILAVPYKSSLYTYDKQEFRNELRTRLDLWWTAHINKDA